MVSGSTLQTGCIFHGGEFDSDKECVDLTVLNIMFEYIEAGHQCETLSNTVATGRQCVSSQYNTVEHGASAQVHSQVRDCWAVCYYRTQ